MSRDDLIIKQLREDLSTHKQRVRKLSNDLKSLDLQYKRVIDELRKQVKDLIDHAPKTFFIWLVNKFKGVKK